MQISKLGYEICTSVYYDGVTIIVAIGSQCRVRSDIVMALTTTILVSIDVEFPWRCRTLDIREVSEPYDYGYDYG